MVDSGVSAYPLDIEGVQTRVLEAGNGPEVVLFLHGLGARADRWRKNLQTIAEAGFRCIAIDLPGHGFASKGAGFDYGVAGYARFVFALFKVMELESAHLVGTSLGAHVLAAALIKKPEIANSLVLVGATGMFPIGRDARLRIADRIMDRSRDGIRRKLQSLMFNPYLATDRLVEEEWRINNSFGATESFEALARYFTESVDDDVVGAQLADALGRRRRLVIWGEADKSVPLVIGQKTEALLCTSMLVIPRTAHAPYWEAPGVFNQAVSNFLLQVVRGNQGASDFMK